MDYLALFRDYFGPSGDRQPFMLLLTFNIRWLASARKSATRFHSYRADRFNYFVPPGPPR